MKRLGMYTDKEIAWLYIQETKGKAKRRYSGKTKDTLWKPKKRKRKEK